MPIVLFGIVIIGIILTLATKTGAAKENQEHSITKPAKAFDPTAGYRIESGVAYKNPAGSDTWFAVPMSEYNAYMERLGSPEILE